MARRIFELTDKNNSGDVDQQELFAIASLLVTGDTGQKLRLLFDIYDENGMFSQVTAHSSQKL